MKSPWMQWKALNINEPKLDFHIFMLQIISRHHQLLAMFFSHCFLLFGLIASGTGHFVEKGQFYQVDEKTGEYSVGEHDSGLILNEEFFKCHEKKEERCSLASEKNTDSAPKWKKIYDTTPREIATGRETEQLSTFRSDVSGRAVDGNTDPIYSHGSCAGTNDNPKPWWMVDFGKTAVVYSVTITSRSLGECPDCFDWMQNFDIKVGNVKSPKQNELCKKHASMKRTPNTLFKCNKLISGRYLYIVNNLKESLVFCEVEVSGSYLE